jgi:hypothetical protein
LGPYFRGLKFLWEKILNLILKKLGLKLKKIGLIKFFRGLIIKHFGPYLLGTLGNGLTGLAIGPALIVRKQNFFFFFFFLHVHTKRGGGKQNYYYINCLSLELLKEHGL